MPSVFPSTMRTLEHREINNLIAFQPQTCTPESFKFIDIPTKKPNDDESISWINMSRLYQGEEVPFQIPSFKWLVESKWITKADASDTDIYLSAFELFLPNVPPEKERKRSRYFIRKHKLAQVNTVNTNHVASVGEVGRHKNISKSHLVCRNSREQSDIQFRITAKYSSPLFPENKSTKFNLQPYCMYAFKYQENAESCRQNTIDNLYSSSLPRICPLSSPPSENQVDPSIFPLWKVKLEAPAFSSVPQGVGSSKIKAAVRICKVKKPSSLSKRKMEKTRTGNDYEFILHFSMEI